MSRKHYIAVAAAIKTIIDGSNTDIKSDGSAIRSTAVKIAQDFARIACEDNSNFDTGRFYRACGMNFPVSKTEAGA